MGGEAVFIDVEHALDPVYAQALGVDIDSLLVSQPDTGEQALEICEALVRSGAIDVVVVDSVTLDRVLLRSRERWAIRLSACSKADVPGAAQTDRRYLQIQRRLHLHQPAA